VVNGEARSLDVGKLEAQTRHMRERFEEAVARHSVRLEGGERKASVEIKSDRQYERLNVADSAAVVALVAGAARELGRAFRTRATGGGSDANVYAARGIEIANLGCGMRDIHTVNEWVDLKDLHTTAAIVLETVRLNAVTP
jgi:tripeptide aminopeptidase